MKTIKMFFLGAFILPFLLQAQDSYRMVELSYMKAKPGMAQKFEAAVKAHNAKYHKEGAYEASLYSIATGNEAGWYVWTMGPCTFTDLDGRPDEGGHADDWAKNVDPYVEEYGRVEYWRWNEKLSFRKANDNKMIQILWLDLERGEYYRFKNFMEKIQAIHEKMDDGIAVYNNQFNQNDGRDVAIVWSMANWAEMDKEDWKMSEEYEKAYGEGSWDLALEEWEDCVAGMTSEVWKEL